MSQLLLRPALLTGGYSDEMIAAAQRRSEWHPVRPGAHVAAADWQTLDQDDRHRMLVHATAPKLGPQSVISHTSAARLHGLPVWQPGSADDVIHVYRNRISGGYRKGWINAHVGVLDSGMTVSADGIRTTSVARTVVDCACIVPFGSAVAMADEALRRNLTTPLELSEVLAAVGVRTGIARARQVIAAADRRSESVGESLSRVGMNAGGLPAPDLQTEIRDLNGILVARCDFCWPEFRTVCEFDGRVKYGRLLKPGQDPGEVVWREKLREDAVRDLRWEVVRLIWGDLTTPDAFCSRIRAAFQRGTRFL